MSRIDGPGGRFAGEGLTFDDVLLVPRHSQVLPAETSVATANRFSKEASLIYTTLRFQPHLSV